MSNLVYFKIDSTGTDIVDDRILLISALKVENGERSTFHRYILPKGDWKITPEVTEINGLTEEFIRQNGEDPVTVLNDFNDFISSKNGIDLVTFNGLNFDVRFLNMAYRRYGLEFKATYHRMFDMYDIESRCNRNDFQSTYLRHVGVDKYTVHGEKPEKSPENLEKLFWRMSDEYSKEDILGDFKPVILDMDNMYRADKDGNLVFVRGKHYNEKVIDVIKSEPDYILFLFKNILSGESKKIIINEYERTKKLEEL
jgi:DNA polymerase III alpha subunit (gram-positive type)